jgi:hypothetical protein
MEVRNQQTFFTPLRTLWLSLLPENEISTHYSDALSDIPTGLVTTSVFCNEFFPELVNISRAKVGTLDAERAWFGIRSILKGGVLGTKIDKFSSNNFAQLGTPIDGEEQIPRKHTAEFFLSEELEKLIEIYHEYQKWLGNGKKQRYDDLDIVLKALKVYDGEIAKSNTDADNSYMEKVNKTIRTDTTISATGFKFCDDRIMFSTKATKKIKKLVSSTQNYKRLEKWIEYFFENQPDHINQSTFNNMEKRRCGRSPEGSDILKSKLSKAGRIYFTPLIDTDNENIRIWIHNFTFDHDEERDILEKLLGSDVDLSQMENAENTSTIDTEQNETNLPYDGPYKPYPQPKWEDGSIQLVPDDSNLFFDKTQKETIFGKYPVLIDGLAGTGKTSVLALRGVFRHAMSPAKTNILVTASKAHVVQTISESMRKIKEKSKYPGDFSMNYVLTSEINDKKTQSKTINEFRKLIPKGGFDEIILDECQDITFIEFELLKRMLPAHNVRRFVFAGDPLQTLNPTGFDWNRIKALFIDSNQDLSPSDITIQRFYNNYRSQGSIVKFANAIQRVRSEVLGDNKSQIIMEAKRADGEVAGIIQFDNSSSEHKEAIRAILRNAGSSKAIVITAAPDDAGIIELLSGKTDGEKNDEIMYDLWERIRDENEDDEEAKRTKISDFRQKLVIHSAASVKGSQHEVVVLYKFASSEESRESLSSLIMSKDCVNTAEMKDKINIMFAFSKLYVALTRAEVRVYIIENTEGYDFWKKVSLWNDDGPLESTMFIDYKTLSDPSTAAKAPNLAPTKKATKENFEKFSERWEKWDSRIDLEHAINLGRRMKSEKTADAKILNQLCGLQGDLLTLKSRDSQTSLQDKKKFEAEAIDKYSEAGGKWLDKIVPLKYANGDYEGCLASVKFKEGEFFELVTMVCKSKLGILQASDKDGIVKLLKAAYKKIPQYWPKEIVAESRFVLKGELLNLCNDAADACNYKDHNEENLYKISELTDHYTSAFERMTIYEERNATKQSAHYMSYFNSLKDYIEGMNDAKTMHKTLVSKKENLLGKSLEKEIGELRNFVNRKLLEQIEKPKSDKVKYNLFSLLEEDISAMEDIINGSGNEQKNGLYLAQKLISFDEKGAIALIGKAISDFLILYNNKDEPTTEYIRNLCQMIQVKPKSYFETQPCLSWWSWEKHNNEGLVDGYIIKEWHHQCDLYINSDIFNVFEIDNKELPPKDYKKRIKPIGSSSIEEYDRKFQTFFGSFHRHSLMTTRPVHSQNAIATLVSQASMKYNHNSLKYCINALVKNRIEVKSLSLSIEESNFVVNYLKRYYRAAEKTDNKLLKDLLKLELHPEGRVIEWVKRRSWESREDVFMSNYYSPRNRTINQDKLHQYIGILEDNNFPDEVIKAKEKRILTEQEFIDKCKEMIAEERFEKFCEYYLNSPNKVAGEIETLAQILSVCDIEFADNNLEYLKTSCSAIFKKRITLGKAGLDNNTGVDLSRVILSYSTLSFTDFLILVKNNVLTHEMLDNVELFLDELTKAMAIDYRSNLTLMERSNWDKKTSTLEKRIDALSEIKYLS